jgi:hypothetical protein
VLRQDYFLLPPGDPAAVYEEFAALYLELRCFAPDRLADYFPAVARFDAVDRVLAEDVDAADLFAATRPEGAPDPAAPAASEDGPAETAPAEEAPPPASQPDEGRWRRLMEKADRVEARGNLVRAAILRWRALPAAPPGQEEATRAAAHRDVEQLAARLQRDLRRPEREAADWHRGLLDLLEPASRGVWSVEARFLYDLQKACVDQERDIYAVDLVEWAVTWGRRPVKRLLPNQRLVLTVKHLRSAAHRLTAVRLPEPVRRRLADRLHAAVHDSERQLRERLRPLAFRALKDEGLRPANRAERLARDKLVEELLDRVVERGFLTMGDLRDAVARNQLKLPDLTGSEKFFQGDGLAPGLRRALGGLLHGIKEFFTGDPLIRANRRCARELDGVYHRGEIYLRWLQRVNAVAFGTRVGRFLTRYLLLPFGGAFFLLKGLEEVVGMVHHGLGEGLKEAAPYAVGPLGLFLFGLIHVGPFRRVVGKGLHQVWRGLRGLFYDLPAFVLRLPPVRRFFQSRLYFLCYHFLLRPGAWAALVGLGCRLAGAGLPLSLTAGTVVFLVVSLLLNSRVGVYVEEVWTDGLVRTWQLFRADILPGLFRLVMSLFKGLLEELERLLYTVDEWLRFRPGDSRWSLVWKPVVGLVWFFVTYLVRVFINLFVEPTFNPIKHFPVVTVAAKLIVPIIPLLVTIITTPLEPVVGKAVAGAAAAFVIFFLPGLAGFLVWELKENWKLYRANRPATLRPVTVGSHGETVLHLMKPGFHSGTLPKLYAKLRRKKARGARKQREALGHVEEYLRRFVERDLLSVLAGSPTWGASTPLHLGTVRPGTNRIRFELCCPRLPGDSVRLDFEERSGRLVAGFARAGGAGGDVPAEGPAAAPWLAHLGPEQVLALRDALAGFYKLAGVDLVREQVEDALPSGAAYDVTDEGLAVWPGPGFASVAVYELGDGPELTARPPEGAAPVNLPALRPEQLRFDRVPVLWDDWVETWELDLAGRGHEPPLALGVRLLPRAPGGG